MNLSLMRQLLSVFSYLFISVNLVWALPNGKYLREYHQETVLLRRGYLPTTCTGKVVGVRPQTKTMTVLTAAHCVADVEKGGLSTPPPGELGHHQPIESWLRSEAVSIEGTTLHLNRKYFEEQKKLNDLMLQSEELFREAHQRLSAAEDALNQRESFAGFDQTRRFQEQFEFLAEQASNRGAYLFSLWNNAEDSANNVFAWMVTKRLYSSIENSSTLEFKDWMVAKIKLTQAQSELQNLRNLVYAKYLGENVEYALNSDWIKFVTRQISASRAKNPKKLKQEIAKLQAQLEQNGTKDPERLQSTIAAHESWLKRLDEIETWKSQNRTHWEHYRSQVLPRIKEFSKTKTKWVDKKILGEKIIKGQKASITAYSMDIAFVNFSLPDEHPWLEMSQEELIDQHIVTPISDLNPKYGQELILAGRGLTAVTASSPSLVNQRASNVIAPIVTGHPLCFTSVGMPCASCSSKIPRGCMGGAAEGDSGGPVFNERGLVGVLANIEVLEDKNYAFEGWPIADIDESENIKESKVLVLTSMVNLLSKHVLRFMDASVSNGAVITRPHSDKEWRYFDKSEVIRPEALYAEGQVWKPELSGVSNFRSLKFE